MADDHPAAPAAESEKPTQTDPVPDDRTGPAAAPAELTFPDLPRLELDELLGQLVERAQEVLATQGRLRGLLRANQVVSSGLALPVVLRRIVGAARELVGARYAALGVLAPGGGLAEFVHVGMDEGAAARIGHPPHGKGLLGALIEHPEPIRLKSIADDPRSCGLPPGHPPMNGFLGVPIRIRDEVFGNLYLTESTRGGFTAEDEELTKALAATAAGVVENARLYEAARARGEWLQATAVITRRLLSTDIDERHALRLIAEYAREIADADLVAVLLPDDTATVAGTDDPVSDGPEPDDPAADTPPGDPGALTVEVAVGAAANGVRGRRIPVGASLAGRVFTTGTPLRLGDPHERPVLRPAVPDGLDAGPVLVVPLLGAHTVNGVLAAVRLRGRTGFSAEDLDMASGFANQASVALELARARADRQRAALLDERERIAADLHDHVIQRLFASGLSLQAVAATVGPGRVTDRVLATVADLDATISQIRTAVFALQQVPRVRARGLRARLLDVVGDVAPALGFDPAVRFSGVLDTLPDALVDDLLAVVREALTNAARHAGASAVEVDLAAGPDRLTLDVRDNGAGMADTARRSGLANLAHRAERHGGTLTLGPHRPSGTRLTWSVPLT
jgi:signal transduction histidine kinase